MLRLWVLKEINSRFCSKTQWQMFLLVSGRHVGAHLGGHQHGGSIQISINLGKKFLRISSIRKIAVTWILARVFAYLPSLYFQILDLIDWTVFIFYFDLFWMAWHWKPAIPYWGACVQDTQSIVVWYRPVTLHSRGLWEICWSFLGTRHCETSVIHVTGVPWPASGVFRCWIPGDLGQVKTAKLVWKACLSETNI